MKLITQYLYLVLVVLIWPFFVHAKSDLLTTEENLWLESRNNTILVVPERNNPPFSFNDSSYISQGIFIDYIKLVAEKLDIKLDFQTARTRPDIISGMGEDKSEYVSTLEIDKAQDRNLIFSDPYSTFPVVIAVRKDYDSSEGMTLDNFNNKSIAVVKDSPIIDYIKQNYPRVVTEEVVDNELALQKVALNEVDATVINSASLTYLLSKQSMRSIKVVGSLVPDSKMALVVPKNKSVLASILAKGLKQIKAQEHQQIIDKWISLPNERDNNSFFTTISSNIFIYLMIILIVVIIFFTIVFLHKKSPNFNYRAIAKNNKINDLEKEIIQLESASENLIDELKEVKNLEQDIKNKMQNIQ